MNPIAQSCMTPRFKPSRLATPSRGVLHVAGLRRPVWLEGFDEGVRRWFAEQWLEGPVGACEEIPYRLKRLADCGPPIPRGAGFQVEAGSDSVRIVSTAGFVELRSGRWSATVTPAPGHSDDDHGVRELVAHALHHALVLDGGVLVHAAAFELNGVGVLALAPGGGGKSTVAAAALTAGGRVISDDLVVLRCTNEGCVEAVGLRRHLHLRDGSARLLDGRDGLRLDERAVDSDNRFRLDREGHAAAFAPRTIIDVAAELVLGPQAPAAALEAMPAAALVPHLVNAATPLFLGPRFPHERQAGMAVVTALAASARAGVLTVGPDLLDEGLAGNALAVALHTFTSTSLKRKDSLAGAYPGGRE